MLSDIARTAMQYVLNEFGYIPCDFCDWKATTVDETLLLLTTKIDNKNQVACPICFDRLYPNFNSGICNNTVEGK